MGTCCGYVNQKQDREKTVYTGGSQGNREREIQDVLDKLNDENQNETRLHPQDKIDDQGETSSQRSFLYGSMLQNNIHSMIQNHGTMEQDENEKYKKEPFYGAEALGEYAAAQTVEINLQNIANEEVLPVQSEQIGLEVKEQKKLMISNSKEIKELEKKKSDLHVIKQDTLQAMNPKDKDILLRRASQQFEQQQSLIKQQQQQLIQSLQLLEKQQMIQQQMQQQIAAQQQQLSVTKVPAANTPATNQNTPQASSQQNTTNSQAPSTQQINSEKASQSGLKQGVNLPPLKKPNSQPASQSQPNSPLMSARGRKPGDDVNSSFDSGSVKSVDKPRSIMKRRNNNDLNSSFNSDADSQKSKAKKKVKFKESAFKKTSKKKKSGY